MTEPIHIQKLQAVERARAEALRAEGMDERESMTLMSLAETTDYWDRLALGAKDGHVAFAAIEAECYIRRSERIAAEPIDRGGRTVNPRLTVTGSAKVERAHMRSVGKHAAVARAYVETEARANRRVTRKAIVRHVKKIAGTVKRVTGAKLSPPQDGQAREAQHRAEMLAAIDKLADGTRRTDAQILRALGMPAVQWVARRTNQFLTEVRLIPWLRIDRTGTGTVFAIDQKLRKICVVWESQPALDGFSIHEFLAHLRAEITRQRKEANDEYHSKRWTQGEVNTKRQHDLLDWIEDQLDRIPN